jgi:uncharacterized membrane protein
MTSAITLALFSLVAAGCLDVSFKRYSRKVRSRGVYLAMCGVAWTGLQSTYFVSQNIALVFDAVTLSYGAVAGIILALANLVLIESLTHLNVSLGSTIYRLNTVAVVVLSLVILAEPMSAWKAFGVITAVAAVWMLYDRTAYQTLQGGLALFIWMAVIASGLRAIFAIVAKLGSVAGAHTDTALLIYAMSWIPAGLIYAIWREDNVRLTAPKIAYGAISGTLLCVTVNSIIAAIARGDVSTVVPIANLSFVVALILSAAMGMELFTRRKAEAMVLAGVAIYLLAQG